MAQGDALTIEVRVGGVGVAVDRSVFVDLLSNSVASERADYIHALEKSRIGFGELVSLARVADIPYVLFFAPAPVVMAQLELKVDKLLAGVSKQTFSMNSRSSVRLADVELIVKDLLRKQQLLKDLDKTLKDNEVVGCLARSRRTVQEDAERLRSILGFTSDHVKSTRNKAGALEMLIGRLEERQLLVSQSQRTYMPQHLPTGSAKFSGLCVKDKKIPYIFLTGGDAGEVFEPAGRRVFTLVLLAVFVARAKFAPVTYDDRTTDPIADREYRICEELLMPADEIRTLDLYDLEDVRDAADAYRVTPSAMVMRGRRLGRIHRDRVAVLLGHLQAEFGQRDKSQRGSTSKPVNGVRKYNGVEYSRRMLAQLDAGRITPGEFCRVVALKKLQPQQIGEFRAAMP